jgi:hypothetical protein
VSSMAELSMPVFASIVMFCVLLRRNRGPCPARDWWHSDAAFCGQTQPFGVRHSAHKDVTG